MAEYVFGLDGGGTGSRLRVADRNNRTVALLTGEGINPNAVDPVALAGRLRALFGRAFAELGVGGSEAFGAGCVAAAGMESEEEKAEFERLLRDELGFRCPLELVSDPDAALVGGLRSREGLILIAGTGSVAVARLSDGSRFRAGGLGHFLGDEGSAFFLGFRAISRSLRSAEGRDLATRMLPALLEYFDLKTPRDFVPLVYRRFDKARIAAAAPLVERFRDEGDPLALDIYEESVRELVALVASVRNQAGERLVEKRLLLWGGLLMNDEWLRDRVVGEIGRSVPELVVCEAENDAAYGACLLALNLYH